MKKKENNTPALLGFIFSLTFCLCIPGLILSIIGLATAKNYKNNRIVLAILGIIFSSIFLLIGLIIVILPEKIDEYATTEDEYYDLIEKYSGEIPFSSAITGANCLTGRQTSVVQTEKYGKVTIEFSYCKLQDSIYLHIYN